MGYTFSKDLFCSKPLPKDPDRLPQGRSSKDHIKFSPQNKVPIPPHYSKIIVVVVVVVVVVLVVVVVVAAEEEEKCRTTISVTKFYQVLIMIHDILNILLLITAHTYMALNMFQILCIY